MLRDVLDITYEISGLIKLSPKRDAKFDKLKKELAPDCPGFISRLMSNTLYSAC